ncbi:MAG: N-acetylmuramoyl-L-alanine amidase [Cyanobacteria bacterium NC_groundwater_1444_Ag_S-0.65um_54_12]|nr:N-acetylmuramoyl-L-alanine amidase [Cyanobacteria bacterium NC_groundwater_1444_Ag_S-0.65um_54_12]
MQHSFIRALLVVCQGFAVMFGEVSQVEAILLSIPADSHAVSGRLIVLDPGHGGRETGAIGPNGSMEKNSNLAVTKALAVLLRQAGAKVLLTREADQAVAAPGAPLGQDLLQRSKIANEQRADLFLSIHHNATRDETSTQRSVTETYYKMADTGASREAALAIHQRLASEMGATNSLLLPGNFLVLRAAEVPAVLGEADYINNPLVEQRLGTPEGIQQEAKAYFLGICDYFAPGIPRIADLQLDQVSDPLRPEIQAKLVGDSSPIDPMGVLLEVNGKPVQSALFRNLLTWRPSDPLPNGDYQVALRIRNLADRTSRTATASFRIAAPPAGMTMNPLLPALPRSGPLPILIGVTDALARPVADNTKIQFEITGGQLLTTEAFTRNGQAIAYVMAFRETGTILLATCDKVKASFKVNGIRQPILTGQVSGKPGFPLVDATILAIGRQSSLSTRSNQDGFWWLPHAPAGLHTLRVAKRGFRSANISLNRPRFNLVQLEPIGEPLTDQLIVIDPEDDDNPRGTAIRQASDINWRVASYLKELLTAVGANVLLTRALDDAPSDLARVRMANAEQATLFLRIGHQPGQGLRTRVEHYPGSTLGKRLAESISQQLSSRLGTANAGAVANTGFALVQTSSTAVVIYPSGVETLVTDENSEARLRAEAYAIYLGLLPPEIAGTQLRVQAESESATPLSGVMIELDGIWIGQTDQSGGYAFSHVKPGNHTLTVSDGKRFRTVDIIDLQPGEERSARIMLDRTELPADLAKLSDH